jgi:uncharacterized membrane protein
MQFTETMEHIARGFEVIGAAVLVFGLAWAAVLGILVWRRTRDGRRAYNTLRRSIGAVLLLGLEVLVAADLVQTVSVEPTIESVTVLGIIVLIRTVLSFSLEVEIEGIPPWRRAAMTGAARIADVTRAARQDPAEAPGTS